MADAARILERVRAHGANVVINAGRLHVVNRAKLPEGAVEHIRQNARAIADHLSQEGEEEERAAIIQFEGKAPREWAEQFAQVLFQRRPAGISELDWSWFITTCGRIIDEAPMREVA